MLVNDTDTDAALGFCWLLENILLLSTSIREVSTPKMTTSQESTLPAVLFVHPYHDNSGLIRRLGPSLIFTQPKGQPKGQKTLFGPNLFLLTYNHKQKSNVPLRKNHKTHDCKGGSTL